MKHLLIFKKWILEGVGDKYLSNKYIVDPEFHDFENRYRSYKSTKNREEIIFNDGEGFIIIKNPKSLENFGNSVRGIIDNEGNLYLEQFSIKIHDDILNILKKLKIIKFYDEYWFDKIPTEFICIQREKNKNLFLISENYRTLKPEEERDYSIKNHWSEISKLKEVKPIFQEYLEKAKVKNPKLNFENTQIKNPD